MSLQYTLIDNDEYGEIEIYGSDKLIQKQQGYSYNPIAHEIISDWNPDYIVIADSMADPFCIDLSLENSPVYFAEHGCDEWDFSIAFNSLRDFLEQCDFVSN